MTKVAVDIGHIAKLANLKLTLAQLKKFQKQLPSVLEYVSKVQQLNTAKIPETSQVTDLSNVVREDKVDSSRMLSQAESLSNARASHKGYFVVKSIF